jgi:cell pole-organizing protein PopZ
MEEILASIRRIIADDDASKSPPPKAEMPPPPTPMAPPRPAPARPVAATPPPPPVEPVMQQDDLDAMLADADKPDESGDVLDLTEAMTAETLEEPEPAPIPMPELQTEPAPPARPLISSSTSAAVDSAFNTLAHTVLVQNARTLEDLVREMLRPLLKSWLDDNLPGMVERLVRAEIERVSRGRG